MARQTEWHFEVVGNGAFPIDMLRYDGAFPSRGTDASAIQRSIEGDRGRQIIRLTSVYHAPTKDRWRSFGWLVGDVGSFREEAPNG
jgi:hypothetical protein